MSGALSAAVVLADHPLPRVLWRGDDLDVARMSRLAGALALALALCGSAPAFAAERYPLPREYPAFPFPVSRTDLDPPVRYQLDLNPGLDGESLRLLEELGRMADEPERLALKIPVIWLMERLGLATPGGWGWLGTQKPDYLYGELGVTVAMALLNRERLPRVAGTVNFETHLHTQCSHDSASDLESILIHAAGKGLQAVAVTDHNQIACAFRAVTVARELQEQGRLPRDFIVVVGEEINTSQGHVIGLFLERYVSPNMTAAETIREIHEQGGLAVAPHQGENVNYLTPSVIRTLPFDAVEVGNAAMFLPFDFYYLLREGSASGRPLLFGMDSHYSRFPGWLGYNRVTVREPTAAALREGIRTGRTDPVFAGLFAGYRRMMEQPVVSGVYRAASTGFTVRDWLEEHAARLLWADGVEVSTGYEKPLRDALNLVTATRVVQDYRDDKGVFGEGPTISVTAFYGPFSLGYQKRPGDTPHEMLLEFRRGF